MNLSGTMMNGVVLIVFVGVVMGAESGAPSSSNPIAKATEMLENLKQTVKDEAAANIKTCKEEREFFRSSIQETNHNIDTSNDDIESSTATLGKANADIMTLNSAIASLAQLITQNGEDLKEAKNERKKQRADFMANEKELLESVDMLSSAISVLRKWSNSGDATGFMQVVNAISVVIEATSINADSRSKLASLIQDDENKKDGDDDDDAPFGQPKVQAYENHSKGIVDTLTQMKLDTEKNLNEARMEEMKNQNAHNLVVQSLEDSSADATADKDRKGNEVAAARELKGKSEGDLAEAQAGLKQNQADLKDLEQGKADSADRCKHEAAGAAEELEAINKALEVLNSEDFVAASTARVDETQTVGGVDADAAAAGFLQVRRRVAVNPRFVSLLTDMAHKFHSTSLAEIAIRARGGDFSKVMGMIEGMIAKLKEQLRKETKKHEYCKKNIAETTGKKNGLEADLEAITARVEQGEADIATLKQEVADLSNEITELDSAVAEATKIRNEAAATFGKESVEFQAGIAGLQKAIEILTTYFGNEEKAAGAAHEQHPDTATTIISMLDTTLSDFQNSLAEAEQAEKSAADDYAKSVFRLTKCYVRYQIPCAYASFFNVQFIKHLGQL